MRIISSETKRVWWRLGAFPLGVLAFAGVGVERLFVFTTTTRWLFLSILLVTLIVRRTVFIGLNSRIGLATLLYIVWCGFTTIWSDIPELSAMKAVAMALTVVTFLSAGHEWALKTSPRTILSCLLPMTLLALVAGSGGGAGSMKAVNSTLMIYQGMSGNPNFLGMIVAIAIPYPAYLVLEGFYVHRRKLELFVPLAVLLALLIILMLTGSRASSLCVLATLFFGGLSLNASKKAAIVCTALFAVLATVVVFPQVQEQAYHRFILKGNMQGELLFSRADTWAQSYEAALQGGYVGLGYGVSAGDTSFEGGLTAQEYGREKGNSQLAVWEETGFVGLVLHIIVLLAILTTLFRGLRASRDVPLRLSSALIFGAVFGMMVESAFEAWWVAPGSIQAVGFWALVGLGSGVAQRAQVMQRSRARRPLHVGRRPGGQQWTPIH